MKWQKITKDNLPPENKSVLTKVKNYNNNQNNERVLIRKKNLYYTPDDEIYVYYTPTHFKI